MHKQIALIAAVVSAATIFSTSADALRMTLASDSGPTVEIVDTDADGVVTYNGVVGGFTLNFTIATSKPQSGTAYAPSISLVSLNANNFGTTGFADKLTISVTDTDFLGPVPGALFNTNMNSASVAAGGDLSLETWLDTGNAAYGEGTLLASIGAGGGSESTLATTSAPYSLTMIATIDHSSVKGQTQFDAVVAVAEPAALGMFGIGLVALGIAARRRRTV